MSTERETHGLATGADPNSAQPLVDDAEIGEVCIANISMKERRKRLNLGVIMSVVSTVLLAVLVGSGLSRWWRLALFIPLAVSASGFFQWQDKT